MIGNDEDLLGLANHRIQHENKRLKFRGLRQRWTVVPLIGPNTKSDEG